MKSRAAVHSVQFYDSHETLIDRLCGIVSSALLVGDTVLIVATEQHREQLIGALSALEVDVLPYAHLNRLVMCDAEELLGEFMLDGLPDPELFNLSLGKLLDESRIASPDPSLVVFGEMVAVLWDEGNRVGALALEHLWNVLLKKQEFQLHCAYPRTSFPGDEAGIFNICETHSQVLGVPAQSTIVN